MKRQHMESACPSNTPAHVRLKFCAQACTACNQPAGLPAASVMLSGRMLHYHAAEVQAPDELPHGELAGAEPMYSRWAADEDGVAVAQA